MGRYGRQNGLIAELFNLSYDVGPGAHPRVIARLIGDYAVLTDTAVHLAELDSLRSAERYVADRFFNEGPRGLRSMAQEREISYGGLGDLRREKFEFLDEEWELLYREFGFGKFGPTSGRRAVRRLLYGDVAGPSSIQGGFDSPWNELINRLVADEATRQLPSTDFAVRRLLYENPSVTEIVAASGAAAAGFSLPLNTIVTLGARRRSANARANSDERIRQAAAHDFEDQVAVRIELRRLLMEQVARGDLLLRPADISEDFINKMLESIDRLSRGELHYERSELPTG